MISVKVSTGAALRSLRSTTRAIQQAEVRALNKAARQAETAVRRELAADIGTTQTVIKKRMFFKRAIPGALRVSIGATGKRIPLIALKARQTRRGVTYTTRGQRRRIEGAFIATMRSGHRGVFKRLGKKRLPVTELHGPSVPNVFVKARFIKLMQTVVKTRLPRIFDSELKFTLSRRK